MNFNAQDKIEAGVKGVAAVGATVAAGFMLRGMLAAASPQYLIAVGGYFVALEVINYVHQRRAKRDVERAIARAQREAHSNKKDQS